MSHVRLASIRRVAEAILVTTVSALGMAASAQAQGHIAFPMYSAEHALQGLYTHQLPPLWRAFDREAEALTRAARQHCAGQTQAADLKAAWSNARQAWMAASNPAVGAVITRRSQREIDFWPPRPSLLQKALDGRPESLAHMERVGGPAKGFPAMESLLAAAPSPLHCPYLALIAEGIEVEAKALRQAFAERSTHHWADDEDVTRTAFAEWVNQWLGGVEQLRWQQIEQPLQKSRTTGAGQGPAFARQTLAANIADWQAQWGSLREQARLTPGQRLSPPAPGQALVPIEALLLGKGHIALADRWAQTVDAASTAMSTLPKQASAQELLALSQTLKAVTSLYQHQVAAALDVPLGFSSADGD